MNNRRNTKNRAHFCKYFLAGLVLGFDMHSVGATEMVYVPVNPNFGGSPLNAAGLLNAAQAQNKHKDPESFIGKEKQSALQQFNESLQRSILGRLAAAATANVVGADGKLQPGTVETVDFVIAITDLGGGTLRVTTTDKATGAVTSFEVGI